MKRSTAFAVCILLTSLLAFCSTDMFRGYKAVQVYEVKPGLLAMPRFTASGEICEIGIQKEMYSPHLVTIDPTIDQAVLDQVLEKFAPASSRGPYVEVAGIRFTYTQFGDAITKIDEYKNVTIRVFASDPAEPGGGNMAASIQWTGRKCS